ncbi:DUF6498-containing protein [Nocardioides sp. Soil805]|uniref:DUF6498-containing protein n=1 Tax=Nocardioides sp. Soil805 TaxID=1736416 RepID=UPI0007024074|nr:hypothetical protein [Nocardioides sp. Soil805]KRF35370.1 hypothetical protein ASG94_14835 [Nocardioides sp. Soil805]
MPAPSRWSGLVGIAVGNLLPLVLVWTGRLEVGDLVLVYFLELVVAYVLLLVALPGGLVPGWDGLKLVGAMLLGGLVLGLVLALYTFRHVTWDATTLGVVALTLASSSVGFVASTWRRRDRWRDGLGGAFGWRFALMCVALMAASAGDAQAGLLAAGWQPHEFGRGWALPAGELLTRCALALDLSPVVVAAGILCTYRLVNELLYEAFDILRDEALSERRVAAPARPTADRA